jgi:hypothetical protein
MSKTDPTKIIDDFWSLMERPIIQWVVGPELILPCEWPPKVLGGHLAYESISCASRPLHLPSLPPRQPRYAIVLRQWPVWRLEITRAFLELTIAPVAFLATASLPEGNRGSVNDSAT